MTTKAKGTSVRQRLINLSVEIGVPFQNLETAFILERLVARLSGDAELQKHLVFRGRIRLALKSITLHDTREMSMP